MSASDGAPMLPYTSQEYLDSLDDGREVLISGERVKNIAEHPGFRNTARMIARLYDALHRDHKEGSGVLTCPTEWGGFTHRYFVAPRAAEELRELAVSAAELSRQIEVPVNRITAIINGQRGITLDTALRLGHWFGSSAEF
jgi:aromatic ring hydroxylase